MKIRVLLVDDHPVVREGLRAMLRAAADLDVVGEAEDGPSALEAVERLAPQVVLMDVRLPGASGIEVARDIVQRYPGISVLLLTVYDSELYLLEGLKAGASGFLPKDSPAPLILHGIRAAAAGASVVALGMVRRLMGDGREPERPADLPGGAGRTPPRLELTPRELEVLRLVAEGRGNREISGELNLAEVTVKKHVQALVRKLGARDRTHAAVRALRLGVLE